MRGGASTSVPAGTSGFLQSVGHDELQAAGAHALLVGTALMRSGDPGAAIELHHARAAHRLRDNAPPSPDGATVTRTDHRFQIWFEATGGPQIAPGPGGD